MGKTETGISVQTGDSMKNQLAYSVFATMMLLSSVTLTISGTAEGMFALYFL